MAVDTELSAIIYNAAGRGPYPIPFPFLERKHIALMRGAVLVAEGLYNVAEEGGQSVVRLAFDPGAGEQITVFRLLPAVQQWVFSEGGEFQAKDVESALDHQMMVIHQILRIVTGGLAGTGYLPSYGAGQLIQDVLVWPAAGDRSLVTPGRAGRLGVQLSDKTLWISNSATLGDWFAFVPPAPASVWSPDSAFRAAEVVVTGQRWLGAVPRGFIPEGGVRLSVSENAGMSVELQLTIGPDNVSLLSAGTYSWPYYAGVNSVLIPFSAFNPTIRANQMSAGNRVVCSVFSVSGPYGFVLKGLRADFIGRWLP